MSTHYCTRLGYGFFVSREDVEQLYLRGSDSLLKSFKENTFTHPLNSNSIDTPYFFGLLQGFVFPGHAIEVPTRRNYSHADLILMLNQFKEFFPNRPVYVIKDYILSCID